MAGDCAGASSGAICQSVTVKYPFAIRRLCSFLPGGVSTRCPFAKMAIASQPEILNAESR